MIEKRAPITIREIGNGLMIEPARHMQGTCTLDENILAFNEPDDFFAWIKSHFLIYDTQRLNDEMNDKINDKINDKRSDQPLK